MNIKFLNLKISNFLAFGDADIALNDLGYVLVSGVNNNPDDLAKSNGSGKSSIWEAVIWCLTGDTIRGTKQVVNKFTTGGTFVELSFIIDGDTYKVVRYKDHKDFGTNLKVFINDIDKSGKGIRDTEKLLEQYLPDITTSFLGSVVILGQGLPQRFSNNTPSGRKEVLEKLSKSDFMIEDIKDKLSKRKVDLSVDLRKYEDLILSCTSKKGAYEEQLSKLIIEQSSLIPKNWETELNTLNNDLTYSENRQYSEQENLEIAQYRLQTLQEDLNRLDVEYSDYQLKKSNELHDKTEPLVQKKLQCNFEKQQLYKDIQEAKNVRDICPTCGQKIPDVHIIDTTEMEAKHKHFEELIENYSCQIQELKSEYCKLDDEFVSKQNIVKKDINYNITTTKAEISTINTTLTNVAKDIDRLKANINKLTIERDTFESKQKQLCSDIDSIKNNIDIISKEILYNNISKDSVKASLDIINKMITIATRDFRGFLLSEVIKYIDSQAKIYSQDIFETDKIDFKLDGNNIDISYCDKQYENLSGGEKQKVDLIVQFSIRDMLSRFLNFSSNILVLDEIFDNCDNVGCQRILNLISSRLTDIESIFIVTHHTDISIPYDSEIIVEKGADCISRII